MSTQEAVREAWLERLKGLMERLDHWALDNGWATRQIETTIRDGEIGSHDVPALLLQKDFVQIAVQPYSRRSVSPEIEGIVDVYLMPQYEDMASLFHRDGAWHVAYAFRKRQPGSDEFETVELTRESFLALLADLQNGGTR